MNRLKVYAKDLARKAVDRLPWQPKVASAVRALQSEAEALRSQLQTLQVAYSQLSEVEALRSQLQILQVAYSQLRDVVMEAGGGLPPPQNLQVRVYGLYAPEFLESGRLIIKDMNNVLATVNEALGSRRMILDFGCGCARVLRALHSHLPSQTLYGTDIDAEAIEWCKANYSGVAEFSTNPAMPPTKYSDSTFDFIYSISIFTHLPEDMQFAWLQELYRIAKLGAYLLLSVHGENHYSKFTGESRQIMQDKGFYYHKSGDTEGLPSFYQTAFHSNEYIRSRWSDYFEIVCIKEVGISNWQDAVLCRKGQAVAK